MMQYTDDPCILAVGADLMHRIIRAWHWLTAGMRSLMAIPEKRTLGTSARWLGIKFLVNLGICYLPTDKALRAIQDITLMLDQGSNFDKYRTAPALLYSQLESSVRLPHLRQGSMPSAMPPRKVLTALVLADGAVASGGPLSLHHITWSLTSPF